MKEHIAVQNKRQYMYFLTETQESDQVIIVAPPPSPPMHDHDRVIIYCTPPA